MTAELTAVAETPPENPPVRPFVEGVSSKSAKKHGNRRQLRLLRASPSPVVRWVGGKTQLLSRLLSLVPHDYGTYFEPFCGGAALFFRISPARAVLSDSCVPLMECYREIARDPRAVIHELGELTEHDPLSSYYAWRDAWNFSRASWPAVRRAAVFLYLNKTCFNGLWRLNAAGELNTPVGSFSSGAPSYPSLADLVAAGALLGRSDLLCQDYTITLSQARRGDFVYIDSPYPRRSKTSSFARYSASGFSEEDHRRLAQCVRSLIERGVHVLVSQPDVPLIREIYHGLEVHECLARRSVAARASSRARVPELIFRGLAS